MASRPTSEDKATMSTRRPQNGPSFSKAPYKKPKPLTDEELAEAQERIKRRDEQTKRDADEAQRKIASGRRFGKAMREFGGIPVRGRNAEAFWKKLKADDKE